MTATRIAILCLAAGGKLLGQSYYGSVTSAGCGSVNGWAWNSTSPQTSPVNPIEVALYADTVYLGSWPASGYSGSNGNSYSEFSIPIPAALQDNRVHAVSVSYGTTNSSGNQIDIPIGGSTTQFTTTIQCTPSSSGYQYYFTDSFQSIGATNWIQNGSPSVATGEGLIAQTREAAASSQMLTTSPCRGQTPKTMR